MSQLVSTTKDKVRYLLRDRSPSDYVFSSDELDREIMSESMLVGSLLGLGPDWLTGKITLVIGSLNDYTLYETGAASDATNWQFFAIHYARIAETGTTLPRVSWLEIQRAREGMIASSTSRGDPTRFAIWETTAYGTPQLIESQAVKIRFDTIPSDARTIDFYRSLLPDNRISDTTELPFSEPVLRGIEKTVAGNLLSKIAPALADKLGLDKSVAPQWQAEKLMAVVKEKERRSRLSAAPYAVGRILGQ